MCLQKVDLEHWQPLCQQYLVRALLRRHFSFTDGIAQGNFHGIVSIHLGLTFTVCSQPRSPHVCGLSAYYLSLAGTAFSPSAEDYTLAGEAVPFHLIKPVEATLSSLSWPSQLIFGKLREWTGFNTGKVEITKKEHHGVTPRVLKNAIVRLSTRGILTVSCTMPFD